MNLKTVAAVASVAAAASAVYYVASPAATQAWVTNYVDAKIQTIEDEDLPTNVVSGAINVDAGTLVFTVDGTNYTVGISTTVSAADQAAFFVYESTDPDRMPTNTIFALENATGQYVNRTIAFPTALDHTLVDGCSQLSQTSGVWRAISGGNTNMSFVAVESNRVHQFSFSAMRKLITREEALRIGVTNAVYSASARSPLDYFTELLFGTAYAANAGNGASRATTFSMTITLTLPDSTTRTQSVPFQFGGEYHDWNVEQPVDGYEWQPGMWPLYDDWYKADNWVAENTTDKGKIVITSYIDEGGVYVEQQVAVTPSKLAQLAGTSISACIPTFVEPDLVEQPKDYKCKKGNHYWVDCVCSVCGKQRAHNLTRQSATECDRCSNYNGYNSDPSSYVCGSTKSIGNTRSAQSHHYGWRDTDGIELNMMACTCECGDWSVIHVPSGEKYDIGEGMLNDSGEVVSGTADEYHHFSVKCQAEKGDNQVCGAKVNYNEAHDFHAQDGAKPHPFIGLSTDPENITVLAYGSQDEDANNAEHYFGEQMVCTVCEKTKDGFQNHYFDSDSCECEGCGLTVHEVGLGGIIDGGYTCGSKTVPGCSRCNTYSESGSRANGRLSNLTEPLHDIPYGNSGFYDSSYHWCQCGRVKRQHTMQKSGDTYVCKFCGYETSNPTPGMLEPNKYVIGGCCGAWQCSDGSVFVGGDAYDESGVYQTFQTTHKFESVTNWLCARCVNINPLSGNQCGERDAVSEDNHGGWHHSIATTNGECVCQCGMFAQGHDPDMTATNAYYKVGPSNTCLKVGNCWHIGNSAEDKACGHACSNLWTHAFVVSNTPSIYVDETNHQSIVVCEHQDAVGCGFVTNELRAHFYVQLPDMPVPDPDKDNPTNHVYLSECTGIDNIAGCFHTNAEYEAHAYAHQCKWKNNTTHIVSNLCTSCGYAAFLFETNHVASTPEPVDYRPYDSKEHMCLYMCVEQPDGCNSYFAPSTDVHRASAYVRSTDNGDGTHSNWYNCALCRFGPFDIDCSNHTVSASAIVTIWRAITSKKHAQLTNCLLCNGLASITNENCALPSSPVFVSYSSALDGQDMAQCFRYDDGCTNLIGVTHQWVYADPDNCKCSNGSGHLLTPHDFDDDYMCRRCGYSPTICDDATRVQ